MRVAQLATKNFPPEITELPARDYRQRQRRRRARIVAPEAGTAHVRKAVLHPSDTHGVYFILYNLTFSVISLLTVTWTLRWGVNIFQYYDSCVITGGNGNAVVGTDIALLPTF